MVQQLARCLLAWRPAFADDRTWRRVVAVLFGMLLASGRRTVTASLCFRSRDQESWAADYLAFSRAPWKISALFDAVVDTVLPIRTRFCLPNKYLTVALDDTSLRKTGKKIAAASWLRDPLSPPFHLNLRWGLRYVHLAAVLPFQHVGLDPRAISIAFTPAPVIKKPRASASEQDIADFKVAKKSKSLTAIALGQIKHLRDHLDGAGHKDLWVLVLGDGSYTNGNILKHLPDRVEYLGRSRGDVKLCRPAAAGGKKVYGDPLPTPNAVRQDSEIPWNLTELFYAGQPRRVKYKTMDRALWQTGTGRRLVRVFIIAPTPYRAPGKGKKKWYYRDPAYLITTDLVTPAEELIQAYLARWQIEVEHRDLKTGIGVGQAQVFSDKSVERLHSAYVALWSMTKLAALDTFGLLRTSDYPERPAWYPQQDGDRASQADIIAALRDSLELAKPEAPPRTRRLRSLPRISFRKDENLSRRANE